MNKNVGCANRESPKKTTNRVEAVGTARLKMSGSKPVCALFPNQMPDLGKMRTGKKRATPQEAYSRL